MLKDLFGQRHYIVRSMIDEVTKPGSVSNDSESLSSYATKLVCCADALERLGYLSDLNSVHTIEKVLSKLPRFMIVDWVKHSETIYRIDREPEFRDLCEFVSAKASLQRNRYSHLLSDRRETTLRERPKPSRTFAVSAAVSSCAKCQGGHSLENCPEFLSLDVKSRWDLVSQGRLCFRCLCLGHRADKCLSRKLCELENCRRMHHKLLHSFDQSVKVTSASCQKVATGLGVSMGVVPLIAEGPKGVVLINALLDTGADTSLVQEELVSRLGLVGDTGKIRLNTPLGDSVQKCSRVSFRVRSLDGQQTIDIERAYTINSVIDIEAVRPSDQTLATWSHLEGIQFTPLPSQTVNLIIGLDTPEAHWILDQRRGRKGDPYADLTPFGWVLRGPLDKGQRTYGRAFSVRVSLEEIDENLRKLNDHDFADNSACETAFPPDDERALDMEEKVDGENNPADLASRGMELTNDKSEIWLNGPKFLREPGAIVFQSDWTSRVSVNLLEMKTDRTACAVSRVRVTDYLQRFSSWTRLLKCVAWLLRYKTYLQLMANGRGGMNLRLGNIKIDEMRSSGIEVLKTIQRDSFPDELRALTEGSSLPNNRRLRKLCPVLLKGLFCVGGRLQWSCLSEVAKHPIILPTKHHVIDLIIRHYHEIEGHVGRMQVLAAIRRKFWILQGGSAVRRVVGACMRCRKQLAQPSQQQMSPLPSLRSGEPAFAFSHVGVDYFGPMYVKRGRVEEKRYGCLFTCLHMRAVHIEVTHCLSTDSFIQALVRFMARRGQPRTIVSDNGSNLKGAHIELRQCLQSFSQKRINDFLLQRDIEWQFIPPDASHWGGVWERMVRSIKRVLMTISHGQRMTDESLLTFLTEAERIVNNRPLVALSEDHKDLETLTPNQLLLLRANQTILDEMTFSSSCLRWWRRLNVLADTFWKRWKIEYLATLSARHKWLLKCRNFKVGDLVLVTSEFIGRNHWPLGLIQEVFPGIDGLVREVLVRTARGVLKRDARKLCLLEGADD